MGWPFRSTSPSHWPSPGPATSSPVDFCNTDKGKRRLHGVLRKELPGGGGWRLSVATCFFTNNFLRSRFAGIAHLLLFYGFVILFIGTCLVFLEHDTPLHFFYGRFYLIASLIIDLGGVAFLLGLGMFLYRRMFGQSQRILQRFYVAALIWLLLVIGVTGFLLEGARIAVDMPSFERWSVVGYACALDVAFARTVC